MVEFSEADSEFNNFLKATSYIQEYTRKLLEKSSKKIVKIPDNLMNVNQLTWLVKKYMAEQQELAEKVEKVHEMQRSVDKLVRERLDKCQCGVEMTIKSIITKDTGLHDIKREDGTEYSLRMPCTSNFPAYFDSSLRNIEAEAQQQKIDWQLLKMMESVSSPPINESSSSSHTPEEKGSIRGLQKLEPFEIPFFLESPDCKRNGISKLPRKRPPPTDTQIGPYPCNYCDKTFRQKHGLSQHLLTHESNGAFECDGCGKRYSRQESVYRHQRSTQCVKYQTLTNVRHDDVAGPSDPKNLHLDNHQRAFFL